MRPGLAVDGEFQRTATTPFRTPSEDDPPGQKPLKIAPYHAAISLRWRLGDDLTPHSPFVDLAPGFRAGTYVHFSRQGDQTVSVS